MKDVADTVTVILRADEDSELYLRSDFEKLAAQANVRLHIIIGLPPAGRPSWLSEAALEQGHTLSTLAVDLPRSDVFICGPPRWTALVEADARTAGRQTQQIHTERFNW
jgi:NAD(P)H-flavin reductase